MLNRVIDLSIRYRALVVCAAIMLLLYGAGVVSRMPVDVLPDLNRPVVTILGGLLSSTFLDQAVARCST